MKATGRTLLIATLAAGTAAGGLDILYAIGVYGLRGATPTAIFQSIATGVLGPAAFEGGAGVAAFGAVLHFSIAIIMAAAFVFAARARPGLLRAPLAAGVAYGLLLFVAMYFVVVPLSASPVAVPAGWYLAGALFAHTALVGIPIALITRRAFG